MMDFKESKFISFMGGINLIFSLILMILITAIIYLLSTISFIFTPVFSIITPILTPFLVAIIFYYMFIPLVDFLNNKKVPRSIGALIALLILMVSIFTVFTYIIPLIITQITTFINAVPSLITNFTNTLEVYSKNPEFQIYYTQIINWLNEHLLNIANQMLSTVGTTLQGISSILSVISSLLFTLMTFPIFLFFMLIDGRTFKNLFLTIFPIGIRNDINRMTRDINFHVGEYIKGRLVVSLLIGIYYFILFAIIQLPYAFVLAFIGGLLSLIPYLGAIIALVPILMIAATTSLVTIIISLFIWSFAQILDGNILGPIIIGKNLKMHPLTIIIVLIGAGNIMGITGMIIGIPIYSSLKIISSYIFTRFKLRYKKYFNKEHY